MTDAPEGPAEGEPERGSRRSPRVDGGGSPVGSTLSIVLAVIAVIAGFFILRAITDDDGDSGGHHGRHLVDGPRRLARVDRHHGIGGADDGRPARRRWRRQCDRRHGVGRQRQRRVRLGSQHDPGAGRRPATRWASPGNNIGRRRPHHVRRLLRARRRRGPGRRPSRWPTALGGLTTEAMPNPPPIDKGLGTSTVLLMVGTDTAGKTLAELAAGDDADHRCRVAWPRPPRSA